MKNKTVNGNSIDIWNNDANRIFQIALIIKENINRKVAVLINAHIINF